jgi:hypothetical protein
MGQQLRRYVTGLRLEVESWRRPYYSVSSSSPSIAIIPERRIRRHREFQ